MTRDHGEPRGDAAMRDGNSSERGRGDRRADPGNDFVRDGRRFECERFFAAAAEHEWIAALEANDALAASRRADHQPIDRVLGDRMATGALPDEESLRFRCELEQLLGDERVVEHEVGAA